MRQGQIKNIDYLKDRRKELRRNLTPAEAALWKILKGKNLGDRKFRRQQSIENYIADFCCPAEKLIIELDGNVHNDPGQTLYDFERDDRLMELGYTVLRFENRMIFEQPDNVVTEIEKHLQSK